MIDRSGLLEKVARLDCLDSRMGRIFAFVRPEARALRERISGFLDTIGYRLGPGLSLDAKTPDEEAASWADRLDVDLLVLPYHLHRDVHGQTVDGIGIALLLSEKYESNVPILMPVSAYSLRAGFNPRLEVLRYKRPLVARCVVPMTEHDIGSTRIVAQLRRVVGAVGSIPAPPLSAPPTVRHAPGYTGRPLTNDTAGSDGAGAFTTVPPVRSYRSPEVGSGDGTSERAAPLQSGYFTAAGKKPGETSNG
jgi:hypothetical protein